MNDDRNEPDGLKTPESPRDDHVWLLTEHLASRAARRSKRVGLSLQRFCPHE